MLFDKIQLEEDEKLLKVVRKHWFIPFVELFGVAIMALVPIGLTIGISIAHGQEWIDWSWTDYAALTLFASALWWVICSMMAAMIWTHYYLDLWVITDRRLIVIEQLGFFNRKTSNFRLERLQDVKVRVSGIIATLLNFGTVRAQTASAADSSFKMTGLPDPRGLQATVQQAMDARINRLNDAQFSRNF